jgi:hypothetical protein
LYTDIIKLANRSRLDDADNFTDQVVYPDGQDVHLEIQIVNELNIGIWNEHLRLGHMFMLVYSATSRTSFENIARYQRLISQYKEIAWYPTMVVSNHADIIEGRQVFSYEGSAQALSQGSLFNETSVTDSFEDIHQMFCDVVRLRWQYESMSCYDLRNHWRNCSEEECETSHRKLFGQLLEADRAYERDVRETKAERARAEARRAQIEEDEARRKQRIETTQRTPIKSQERSIEVGLNICAVNEAHRKARDEDDKRRYERTKQKLAMLVAGPEQLRPELHQ